jgi:hypothetical protein
MKGDGIILFEALCEFLFWTKYTGDIPVLDELTDGLRSTFVDKIVPLWVAYAAQIFVDIHNVLQENVRRGLSQLQASGTQIASNLKEYHSNTPVTSANWPAFSKAAIRHLDELINRWILGDALDQVKRKSPESSGFPAEPFALFKRHPLLCGLFQFKLYTYLQYISMELLGAWGSVFYVAHVYEACRQGGYLKHIWSDMELVMDVHSRRRIFAGRVPQNLPESLKCMVLTLGVSPVNFAQSNPYQKIGQKPQGIEF